MNASEKGKTHPLLNTNIKPLSNQQRVYCVAVMQAQWVWAPAMCSVQHKRDKLRSWPRSKQTVPHSAAAATDDTGCWGAAYLISKSPDEWRTALLQHCNRYLKGSKTETLDYTQQLELGSTKGKRHGRSVDVGQKNAGKEIKKGGMQSNSEYKTAWGRRVEKPQEMSVRW